MHHVQIRIGHRTGRRAACVVDQNVQAAELPLDGFLQHRWRRLVREIGHHELRLARAALGDRCSGLRQPVAAAAGQHHVATLSGDRFRDSQSQPAR
jgi:hypothetical protein